MKKLIGLIKKYFAEFLILLGTGLFIYNVFNFSSQTYNRYIGMMSITLPGETREIAGVYYYYSSDTILLITIGAMLIIAGLLIIKNKHKTK